MESDLGAIARAIIDSNRYMTLGTADEAGRPWQLPTLYRLYRATATEHSVLDPAARPDRRTPVEL
jgi:hypothetical protein